MTPERIIEIFNELATEYECVFFAGITAEFLRTTVEKEASQGKIFVVLDLQGLKIRDDYQTRNSKVSLVIHVIKQDKGDSVSQEADNLAPYDAIQTICLECYNVWVDMLQSLRADNTTDDKYVNNYNDITVTQSDATFFIKPKLLGLMSGCFINIEATGRVEC